LVPRDLENDVLFHEAVYARLELAIGRKFEDEILKTLGGDKLTHEAGNTTTTRHGTLLKCPRTPRLADLQEVTTAGSYRRRAKFSKSPS
jgi:hypothetical protein